MTSLYSGLLYLSSDTRVSAPLDDLAVYQHAKRSLILCNYPAVDPTWLRGMTGRILQSMRRHPSYEATDRASIEAGEPMNCQHALYSSYADASRNLMYLWLALAFEIDILTVLQPIVSVEDL